MYNEIDLDKIDINAEPPTEEPARQYYFMARCREYVRGLEKKNKRRPTFFIQTFGCQMNARDSEKLTGILKSVGYVPGETEDSDFVIYNTCTVRENANNKVYGRLGYLHTYQKKNPRMMIALCGCMMQEPSVIEKLKKSYSFVNLIFGTHNIYKFAELLAAAFLSEETVIDLWDDTDQIVENLPVQRKYDFKSGVNIMFGCNNFCSYCIVPYVRGRERSRKPSEILSEIRGLVADGVVEVMLLGQNVNSYGRGLSEETTFARFLEEVAQIPGLLRIRFMTSHPKDLSPELIRVMAKYPNICRHLHLPLQSGSSRILRKMNRRYDKEQYLELVHQIRKAVPDIALTTDIIVGFPGETEEDFAETLEVVREVEFDSAFTFIYSKRTGTPAASMEEQVPEDVVKERFERLLALVQSIGRAKAEQLTGTVHQILVEEENPQDAAYVTGRMSNNSLVHIPGDASMIGTLVTVELVECRGFYYMGRQVRHED